jgi:hypothetical protein
MRQKGLNPSVTAGRRTPQLFSLAYRIGRVEIRFVLSEQIPAGLCFVSIVNRFGGAFGSAIP